MFSLGVKEDAVINPDDPYGEANLEGAEPNSRADLGVSPLFLVLALSVKAQSKQGNNPATGILALKLLVCLMKNVVVNDEGSYDVFDFVFNTHFTRLGLPGVPTRFLVSNDVAEKACAEMGIIYPYELEDGFNSTKCVMPSVDVFMVMCRSGVVPFRVLLSLAALLDDGLSLGVKVKRYQPPVRSLDAKRQKVCREEKAIAYFSFLNDVRKGVKASMARPLQEGEKPKVYGAPKAESLVLRDSAGLRPSLELNSQTSKDFLTKVGGYEYKNVMNLGAAIL